MAMEKKTLLKTLSVATLGVCAGIISVMTFANNIEEKYAPQFDANELAAAEEILAVTAQARDAERTAIYDECKAAAMETQAVKQLQRELNNLIALYTLPPDSLYIVYPGFSAFSFTEKKLNLENKIAAEIEKHINATPVMRELNKRFAEYDFKRLSLSVARDEYKKWKKLPKTERIKQNLERRKYQKQDIIAQRYCNNIKSY